MRKTLALLLALPALLPAFGGTQVTWLGGTLPYDTVPYLEADPKLIWHAGTGAPELGGALDLGLTDRWMLQGQWSKGLDGAASEGAALTRFKLFYWDAMDLGAALFAGANLPEGASSRVFAGVSWGMELFDAASFSANMAFGRPEAGSKIEDSLSFVKVGLWGPYITYALRPGLEYGVDFVGDQRSEWLLPQLALNFPGDLSLDLGVRLASEPVQSYRIFTRLSFELFPNP